MPTVATRIFNGEIAATSPIEVSSGSVRVQNILVATAPKLRSTGSGFNSQRTSIDLNGVDEYLLNNTAQDIGIVNAWSVSYWVKLQAGCFAAESTIVDFREVAGNENRTVSAIRGQLAGDPLRIITYNSDGDVIYVMTWSNLFTQDAWAFVTYTWDGSTVTLHYNGSTIAPSTTAGAGVGAYIRTDRRVLVGAGAGGGTPADCRFHSIGLWDKVLTLAEHVVLFNAGNGKVIDWGNDSGNYVSSANLQHWWRIGFDPDDIGADSGNATAINIGDDAVGVTPADEVSDYPEIPAAQVVTFQDNDGNSIFTLDAINDDSSEFVGDWIADNGLWVAASVNEGVRVSLIYSQDGA